MREEHKMLVRTPGRKTAWKTYVCRRKHTFKLYLCRLGGVVVSVLATGPKGCGLKTGQGDGFLRAIKIRNTNSFGWKNKVGQHVKDPLKYLRYWYAKFSLIRPFFLLAPRCLCW
jgi:hypothetical protein